MSDYEESMIQRVKRLEREVERLQKWERPVVITDHGALTGLADNDHPQYLLTTGKAADSDKLDGVDIAAFLGLNSLTDPNADRVLFWDDSAGLLKWLSLGTGLAITGTEIKPTQPQFHPLSSPLTSTAWDGNLRSTVSTSTLIDLSTVFGAPAGVKAVLLRINIKEPGTPGAYYFYCGPGSSYWYCLGLYAQAANVENSITGIVPCNADGDIYYRIAASGSNTMTVNLQIWGYWL